MEQFLEDVGGDEGGPRRPRGGEVLDQWLVRSRNLWLHVSKTEQVTFVHKEAISAPLLSVHPR